MGGRGSDADDSRPDTYHVCVTDDRIAHTLRAADRITDPVQRSDIMRDAGAIGDAETQTWKLPTWPDPLPSRLALRVLFLQRPDLIRDPL
jgi:hypothetical protein